MIEFVSRKNYSFSKVYTPEIKIGQGAEQTVYLNEEVQTVTKFNDAIFYSYWLDYLNSLLIHNYFFPNTSYNLLGFKVENEKLYAVVE